ELQNTDRQAGPPHAAIHELRNISEGLQNIHVLVRNAIAGLEQGSLPISLPELRGQHSGSGPDAAQMPPFDDLRPNAKRARILDAVRRLAEERGQGVPALEIAKAVAGPHAVKQSVNPLLYQMLTDGLIIQRGSNWLPATPSFASDVSDETVRASTETAGSGLRVPAWDSFALGDQKLHVLHWLLRGPSRTLHIAKKVAGRDAVTSMVNPVLYSLLREGHVTKSGDVWSTSVRCRRSSLQKVETIEDLRWAGKLSNLRAQMVRLAAQFGSCITVGPVLHLQRFDIFIRSLVPDAWCHALELFEEPKTSSPTEVETPGVGAQSPLRSPSQSREASEVVTSADSDGQGRSPLSAQAWSSATRSRPRSASWAGGARPGAEAFADRTDCHLSASAAEAKRAAFAAGAFRDYREIWGKRASTGFAGKQSDLKSRLSRKEAEAALQRLTAATGSNLDE
ncbi:unnamed protein product, partial [Polarella glacialis]